MIPPLESLSPSRFDTPAILKRLASASRHLAELKGVAASIPQHEVADIAILMSYLTNDLGIDLDAAVRSKLLINGKKYPVEKAKGSSKKYDELR